MAFDWSPYVSIRSFTTPHRIRCWRVMQSLCVQQNQPINLVFIKAYGPPELGVTGQWWRNHEWKVRHGMLWSATAGCCMLPTVPTIVELWNKCPNEQHLSMWYTCNSSSVKYSKQFTNCSELAHHRSSWAKQRCFHSPLICIEWLEDRRRYELNTM